MNIYNKIYKLKNNISKKYATSKALIYSIIKNKKINYKNIKKVLIIEEDGLGDTILTIPFIESINKYSKNKTVYLAIKKQFNLFFKKYKNINLIEINEIKNVKNIDLVIDLKPRLKNYKIYKNVKYKIGRNPVVYSDDFFIGYSNIIKPTYQNISSNCNDLLKILKIPLNFKSEK